MDTQQLNAFIRNMHDALLPMGLLSRERVVDLVRRRASRPVEEARQIVTTMIVMRYLTEDSGGLRATLSPIDERLSEAIECLALAAERLGNFLATNPPLSVPLGLIAHMGGALEILCALREDLREGLQ